MIKNKLIAIRITSQDYNRIKALKEAKKNNDEVFNLSKLVRHYLEKEIN